MKSSKKSRSNCEPERPPMKHSGSKETRDYIDKTNKEIYSKKKR